MPKKEAAPAPSKRLYRSETNKIIAGVAGGLGEYFGIDPVIIRILFVLAAVWGGSGVLIYLILWLVIPTESDVTGRHIEKNAQEMGKKAESLAKELGSGAGGQDARMWFGVVLLGLGLLFLLTNFSIIRAFDVGRWWPLLLIIFGFVLLTRRRV